MRRRGSEGIAEGADDYLVKPFGARELLARVAAQVRIARMRRDSVVRRSEERLRRMINIPTVGVLLFDEKTGVLLEANDAFLRMSGYTPEDVARGALTWQIMTPPEHVPVSEAQMQQLEATGRIGPYEKEYLRKDGSRCWMVFAGASLEDRTIAEFCIDVTDRKRSEAALRESEAALRRTHDELSERTAALEAEAARRRDLGRRLESAQEDERRRIARDLHDSVGQLLAGLSLAVKDASSAGPLAPAAAEKLAEVQRLVDQTGRETHALAVRLRPTSLDDIGLEAALRQLAGEWPARTGVPIDFQTAGLRAGRLPPEVETVLYRVVQESLTNVGRHAGATSVSVVVSRLDENATAVIEDDGRGFDPEAAGRGRLGLLGMQERVALSGGELSIESAPGGGTTVIATIPPPGGGG